MTCLLYTSTTTTKSVSLFKPNLATRNFLTLTVKLLVYLKGHLPKLLLKSTLQLITLSSVSYTHLDVYKRQGLTEDMAENIQPRFQANIHKEDFTEEQLSKSTKQAVRTARNKGISVQFGGTELLEQFASLMKKTEARKNIHLRGIDYYEKLLTTYPESSYITLSTLDLPARLKDLNKQLEKNIADAAKFTEKTKPGKIENNKQEHKSCLLYTSMLTQNLSYEDCPRRSRLPII